jgi:hypothetical protein
MSILARLLQRFNQRFYPEVYEPITSEPSQGKHAAQEYQAFVYKELDLIKKKQSILNFATKYIRENETLFEDLRSLEKFDKYLHSIKPRNLSDSSPIPRHPETPSNSQTEYVIELDNTEFPQTNIL